MSATASAFTSSGPGWRYRMESLPLVRLGNFGLAFALVGATGLLRWINLASAPAAANDEGLLVQRAWTLDSSGFFARLTDWYDHPPLGWLFLGLWSSATSAFENSTTAIAAGRSLSVVAAVATAGLLWILARRAGLHRWSTALAVVIVGASPLAAELQRQVSFDALAVPWVVAAFAFAVHPRRPLVGFAGSALCFAVAVLTNESSLVLAPVLVWQLRGASLPSIRRYGFVVGVSLFVAACVGYAVHAAVDGSLTAGADHAGLLEGLRAQLLDRPPTGSLSNTGSYARESVTSWFTLDAVGLSLMLFAAVGVLATEALPDLRPYATAALLLPALVFVPGFASPTLIVTALPFGALVVSATVQEIWDLPTAAVRRPRFAATAAVVAASVAAAALWTGSHNRLLTADSDAAAVAVEAWVVDNVPGSRRLLVDDASWTDLAESLGTTQLGSYSALDRDPAVGATGEADDSWRTYDVVVSTEALRRWPERYPGAAAALGESIPVASFGTGEERIELRRIVVGDTAETVALNAHDSSTAVIAGRALSRNPQLSFTEPARANVVSGQVDLRLMTTLVAVGGLGPVEVNRFPADPAEQIGDAPRRSVQLRAASDEAADAIAELLWAQAPPYRPVDVEPGADGRLTITYTPSSLL